MQWQPAAISSGRKIPGSRNSRAEIFIGVVRHVAVGRQKASLRAEDDFVAGKALGSELLQSGADGALAALEAIVDRRIDHIDAAFDRGDDRARIALVGRFIGSPRYVPMPMEEKNQPARHFAKMPGGGAPLKSRRVTQSACGVARPGMRLPSMAAGEDIEASLRGENCKAREV